MANNGIRKEVAGATPTMHQHRKERANRIKDPHLRQTKAGERLQEHPRLEEEVEMILVITAMETIEETIEEMVEVREIRDARKRPSRNVTTKEGSVTAPRTTRSVGCIKPFRSKRSKLKTHGIWRNLGLRWKWRKICKNFGKTMWKKRTEDWKDTNNSRAWCNKLLKHSAKT
jgi:hypothetical protein